MTRKVISEKRLHDNILVCSATQVISKLHFKTDTACYKPNKCKKNLTV